MNAAAKPRAPKAKKETHARVTHPTLTTRAIATNLMIMLYRKEPFPPRLNMKQQHAVALAKFEQFIRLDTATLKLELTNKGRQFVALVVGDPDPFNGKRPQGNYVSARFKEPA